MPGIGYREGARRSTPSGTFAPPPWVRPAQSPSGHRDPNGTLRPPLAPELTFLAATARRMVRSPLAWLLAGALASLPLLRLWIEGGPTSTATRSSLAESVAGLLATTLTATWWLPRPTSCAPRPPAHRARTTKLLALTLAGLLGALVARWPDAFGGGHALRSLAVEVPWLFFVALRSAGWLTWLQRVFPHPCTPLFLALVVVPAWPPAAKALEPLWPAWSLAAPDSRNQAAALAAASLLVAAASCAPDPRSKTDLHPGHPTNRSSS